MVDTCPNCGQPSRAGARFCTSCGFRLPERPVDADSAPLARSPFATTSTVSTSRWPPSLSSDSDESTSTSTTAAPVDSLVAESPQPVLPDDIALPGPVDPVPVEEAWDTSSTETSPEPEVATNEDAGSSYPVWPSFPNYGATDTAAAPAWYAQNEPTASEQPEAVEPIVDEESSADTDAQFADDSTHKESDPETESATNSTEESDVGEARYFEVQDSAPPTVPAWQTAPESPDTAYANPLSGETLNRAYSLLDELSSLLPTLAMHAVDANSTGSTGVADILIAARRETEADDADVSALMNTVELVRTRPRDIDGVLDLSRHVDTIVALKANYDRVRASLDEALAQLDLA